MEKVTLNKEVYVRKTHAIEIITEVSFLTRLSNILINPLRYLITGKLKY